LVSEVLVGTVDVAVAVVGHNWKELPLVRLVHHHVRKHWGQCNEAVQANNMRQSLVHGHGSGRADVVQADGTDAADAVRVGGIEAAADDTRDSMDRHSHGHAVVAVVVLGYIGSLVAEIWAARKGRLEANAQSEQAEADARFVRAVEKKM